MVLFGRTQLKSVGSSSHGSIVQIWFKSIEISGINSRLKSWFCSRLFPPFVCARAALAHAARGAGDRGAQRFAAAGRRHGDYGPDWLPEYGSTRFCGYNLRIIGCLNQPLGRLARAVQEAPLRARAMIPHTSRQNKTPVWLCSIIGSCTAAHAAKGKKLSFLFLPAGIQPACKLAIILAPSLAR